MDQYDVLEANNDLGEFNTDEYSRKLARDSLQLGDFALQFDDNVNISGGNVIIDSFYIRSNEFDTTNLFLTNSNGTSNVSFSNINLPSWVSSNVQKNISMAGFSNDHVYINSNTFDYDIQRHSFIFDESLLKLKIRPSFQEISTAYGYASGFLVSSSNFSDMIDDNVALLNLGIRTMGEQNSTQVIVKELNILSNLHLPFTNVPNRFVGKYNNFITNRQYTFPILLNELSNVNSPIDLPTSKLVHDTFSNMSNLVNVQGVQNIEFIQNNKTQILGHLSDETVLTSNYFLANMTTHVKENILNNLSIGDIAFQNSNSVYFNHVTFSNIYSEVNTVHFKNKLTKYDDFLNNTKEPGFINLANSVSFFESSNTLVAFSNTILNIHRDIRSNFDDFSNDMFKSNDNLFSNDSVFDARGNLGLHSFAIGGRLVDLENRPTYLSELNNDTNFISKYNRLSDLTDKSIVIGNLGISNMAFNSRDIGGNNLRRSRLLGLAPEIDYLVLDEGTLRLEGTTSPLDFLYLISKNTDKGYSYKTLNNADESYMSFEYYSDVDDPVLVRLNDIYNMTQIEKTNVLSRIRADDPYKTAPIINTANIPTAEFAYKRIIEMTSNILTKYSIPFKYYDGWL